ncbi:circadian clock protein KaiB [Hymenobacter sp. HMF4947]|uniref:Circadian clock protein KaiB n=1 Tax=Hymenobacter ginkgonis TaxID=2682976 RepID=A0A7K1T964_9BACT|nr:circadian clock KaiB family protein [Hymenobacter ginkgonis]MVN74935.1 circadian clock protein KaiB [Hymenobacter ginkgonis]
MSVFSAPADSASAPEYDLHLFVMGTTSKSALALRNIQQLCEQHLLGRYVLTVVDVQQHPEVAEQEELLGMPCLIKKRPGLVRRLVGDLSDQARVLKALGLVP